MKKIMLMTILILLIGVLGAFRDEYGESGKIDLGDRVRNCPAVTTLREGPSNTIYVATFGLEPSYSDTIAGIPGTLWKINYENSVLNLLSFYETLEFNDPEYSYLKAYDSDDSTYINNNFDLPESQFRLGGQKGFWASPVLNEEYDVVYLLTKSGMLFTVDVTTMEVDNTPGHYHNLRYLEKQAGASNAINEYEYLATPLFCQEPSGSYLIIPGIWNVFTVPINTGLLDTTPTIIQGMSISTQNDCFVAPAAMDYEQPPNLLIVSKCGNLFRKFGTTIFNQEVLPGNPSQCYFQPTISEDGHFYINSDSYVYRVPVNGRISEGAWVYDFEIEIVDDILGLQNINVSGMEKHTIVSRDNGNYNKLCPYYDEDVPLDCEDIINYDNESYHNGFNYYRLMNNHSTFLQKNINEYCIFSLNNYSRNGEEFSNENYYNTDGEISGLSNLMWEFMKPHENFPVNNYIVGQFEFDNNDNLSYATPAFYYTVEDRINVVAGDEQGCLWTWVRSLAEIQLGFSPLYHDGYEYIPLYPEYGYSKMMDTPPNVVKFATVDSIYIDYLCNQETDYRMYMNSYARTSDSTATAYFAKLMKHPKYTLSIFNSDSLVYRNDSFRLIDENIHHYSVVEDDSLIIASGIDTTLVNPNNGILVLNNIIIESGGTLRIDEDTNIYANNISIEEGGRFFVNGTAYAENLRLLNQPAGSLAVDIFAQGFLEAGFMEIEDEVEANFTGYGGNDDNDYNIKVNELYDSGAQLNSLISINHINSNFSDYDMRLGGDKARFAIAVDGGLLLENLDLLQSDYNIQSIAGNDVQLLVSDDGCLCSIGLSLFRRNIEVEKDGVFKNENGRLRFCNNTDSLFIFHNNGTVEFMDKVYLTGNFYDSSVIPTVYHTGGFEFYLYRESELLLNSAELCVGADENTGYDGGMIIQEGKAAIKLEDSSLLRITSADAVDATHTPVGGILKIDASSESHALICGQEAATTLHDGDRIIIGKKGEINGREGLHPRTVSYLDFIRSSSGSTYWQGIEISSTIDDAVGDNHFEFSDCLFKNLGTFSICTHDSLDIKFTNCSFEENYRSLYITYRKVENETGTVTSNNVNATVTGCRFYNNYSGILIESASGTESLNYLHVLNSDFGKLAGTTASLGNSFGIMAIGEENVTYVTGCHFYDNEYGMYANKTFCTIGGDGQNETNYFKYNTKPVYMSSVSDTTSIIQYNVIQNNDTNGIYCFLNQFDINHNEVSDNLGHGIVAVTSIIQEYKFYSNDIEDNNGIEIYATSSNLNKLANGENTISDANYNSYQFIPNISLWKNYQHHDIFLLASADTPQDSIKIYGNNMVYSDTTRFYPEFCYYDTTVERSGSSYNEGIAAFEEKDYNVAIAELTDFLEDYPYSNGAYTAMTYLYFAEKKANDCMSGYRQFSDIYLPYTQTDTLLYWQDKILYANTLLEDAEYSEAIDGFQEIIEYSPSYDDSLQASIMQGYSYMLLTENGERGTYAECEIETENIGEYCDYLLHCMETEDEDNNVQPVISKVFNYPNPFNPETKICFELSDPVKSLTLSIYNIKGQKVWEYKLGDVERGKQQVIWTGVNRRGRQVASGVYLYRVKAGKEKKSAKMLFLK